MLYIQGFHLMSRVAVKLKPEDGVFRTTEYLGEELLGALPQSLCQSMGDLGRESFNPGSPGPACV